MRKDNIKQESSIMFTWKEIVFTIIIASFASGVGVWQAKKEVKAGIQQFEQREKELMDADTKKMQESVKKQASEQWKTVKMKVTAYCPCEVCCEQWAKIPVSSGKRKTASGHTIHVGDNFVAAPRIYPFGTEMVIEGYAGGKAVKVEDVGGAIKGNKLDIYFDSHKTALIWGVRYVDVKVKVSS
jgi:3D (Asp-Asp-Asp) domain-containing protein